MDRQLVCVIMAAAETSRMKSDYPKVLHNVAGEPILYHVLDVAGSLEPSRIILITNFGREIAEMKLSKDIELIAYKKEKTFIEIKKFLGNFKGELLVLADDTPLLHTATLRGLLERHRSEHSHGTILTAMLHDPTGYGRIVRRESDLIARIVEEEKCTIYEKAIEEVNSRTYCFDSSELFLHLEEICSGNSPQGNSLIDIIALMIKRRKKVMAFMSDDNNEVLCVDSRKDLAIVNKIFHRRIAYLHMENGVTIVDPETTFIDRKVKIDRDSVIHPFTILEGETRIGERCRVGPGSHLISTTLGKGVICSQVVIKNKKIGDEKELRPYKAFGG